MWSGNRDEDRDKWQTIQTNTKMRKTKVKNYANDVHDAFSEEESKNEESSVSVDEGSLYDGPDAAVSEGKMSDVSNIVKEKIEFLTDGFRLTFKDIKGCIGLRDYPLSTVDPDKIKNIIRYEREKLKKKQSVNDGAAPVTKTVKRAGRKRRAVDVGLEDH